MNIGSPSYELTGSGAKRRQVVQQKSFYYVPLYETLRSLLQNDIIYQQVEKARKSTDGILRDFCNGSQYLEHK